MQRRMHELSNCKNESDRDSEDFDILFAILLSSLNSNEF